VSLTAGTVIGDVRNTLLDPEPGVAWSDAELYGYLTSGLLAAAMLKRDINPIVGSIPLVAGTIQTLPSSNPQGLQLLDVYFNTASGYAVTKGVLRLLDQMVPTWRAATATVDVTEAMFDLRSPLIFHVTPPNTGTGAVTALFGAVPNAVAGSGDLCQVPDVYRAALWAYVCAEAYAKNSRRQDLVKSSQLYSAFERWVGMGGTNQAQLAAMQEVATAASEK
jgi:hypothetical protein